MRANGQRIREAREKARLTRQQLAERAGLSKETVKRLELDPDAGHFKYETLSAIAGALDLDFTDVAVAEVSA